MKLLFKSIIGCFFLMQYSFVHADINKALSLFDDGLYDEAYPELLIEAEKGNPVAKYHLGFLYRSGWGVKHDTDKENQWYREAFIDFSLLAEADDAEAQYYLGQINEYGLGKTKNIENSISWYKRASKNEHHGSSFELGEHFERREIKLGVKWYEIAANQGSIKAADKLGFLFRHGRENLPKNKDKAVKWYITAADLWDKQTKPIYEIWINAANSFFAVGQIYHETNNIQKALEWYVKSAERGNTQAMTELGVLYMRGEGIGIDHEKAVEWFIQSHETDPSYNSDNIRKGINYGKGIDVEQDFNEAAKWFRAAYSYRFPSETPPPKTIPAGAYSFTQYVKIENDDVEVKAVSGIIYVSAEYFSDDEWRQIDESNKIRNASTDQIGYPLEQNICIATLPTFITNEDKLTKHSILAGYVRGRTARSGGRELNLNVSLVRWVDWGYGINITLNDGLLEMKGKGGERGFGYKSERFEIQKIDGGNLNSCIQFAKKIK